MRRRKCLGSTERKKPDGCRQETGCGVRKDSHTETEADKGYFAVQDKARKKFRHVRVPEREQVSSVGIGKSHTPITAVTESDESDAAKILELLKNPETAALLKQLAKAL